MTCKESSEQLGAFVDGELAPDARERITAHLTECSACLAELEAIKAMAASVGEASEVVVPQSLWPAIENRLDDKPAVSATPAGGSGYARPAGVAWYRRGPVALAAMVSMSIGLGLFGMLMNNDSAARASTVDFTMLLDALPRDAHKAFQKFLVRYDARESSFVAARKYAPDLNFDIPQQLPAGFELRTVYLLRFGNLPGVAATYDRDGEFLGVLFHRPVGKEKTGPHRDYPCVVGKHEGHKVSVGPWKLVHLMEPSTCHCVLSRLDEQTELPAVMAAVAPGIDSASAGEHDHASVHDHAGGHGQH